MGVNIAILIANGLQLTAQVGMLIYMWIMMENFTNPKWLLGQARAFSFEFDGILIKYSSKIYDLYVTVLNGTIITPELVKDLQSRIYVLLGIVILFKLAATFIKYIAAPETFLDDKTGASKLIKRVIIGCVIIAFVPMIFSFGRRIQSAVLEDRVIERIILPKQSYTELTSGNMGHRISVLVFQGFFTWNPAVKSEDYSKQYNSYMKLQTYSDNLSIQAFPSKYISDQDNGEYIISYVPVISTLAIGFVLYTLIKYALELGVRSIKLAFLEIISPFIILNYMLNPSDDESLKKWVNATISTYLILFLRVLTLWIIGLLAYYLANGLPQELNKEGLSLLTSADPFIKSVVVLAAFAFLKELPKVFSDLTGYNLQENEAVNGLMEKGVGVVKGFAMAKIGTKFAKQQLGVSAVAQGLSAGSQATSGFAKGKKEGGGLGAAAGLMGGLGVGMTPVIGGFSSVISASTAGTPLSGAGQATTSIHVTQMNDLTSGGRYVEAPPQPTPPPTFDQSMTSNENIYAHQSVDAAISASGGAGWSPSVYNPTSHIFNLENFTAGAGGDVNKVVNSIISEYNSALPSGSGYQRVNETHFEEALRETAQQGVPRGNITRTQLEGILALAAKKAR